MVFCQSDVGEGDHGEALEYVDPEEVFPEPFQDWAVDVNDCCDEEG